EELATGDADGLGVGRRVGLERRRLGGDELARLGQLGLALDVAAGGDLEVVVEDDAAVLLAGLAAEAADGAVGLPAAHRARDEDPAEDDEGRDGDGED